MSPKSRSDATRLLIAMLLMVFLFVGFAAINPEVREVFAHEQHEWISVSGVGATCPVDVSNCRVTWTHVNFWTHYERVIPSVCALTTIGNCQPVVITRNATSSCRNTSNCGHGPHSSTPRVTGPGTWTVWKGHTDVDHKWSGRRHQKVAHQHLSPTEPNNPPPTALPTPQPEPSVNPQPHCMTDGIPNNCPRQKKDDDKTNKPNPKVACSTSWSSATDNQLRSALRWESIVPYPSGFATPHHLEVPGGRWFLTAASSPLSAARHWVALKSGANLNVSESSASGCLWTATHVGVFLRELLAHDSADLAVLVSPGNTAAATQARQAASLWQNLSSQRKQWYTDAFTRNDPATVWCSSADLPTWTSPLNKVLSLSSTWSAKHDHCRWVIPRQGFWQWQLVIRYTSNQGDSYTHVVAEDLSWFREPDGYLTQQVTLW
ncbi:MAG: hypothetical protein F4138_04400 [Acidimicrobiia bacterium]|nr:hypothetical protein [Acidimicrobiia bacterium]MYC58460.1 hypothetical protein [Acidimicrobiia bacterium]MYG94218.1 hypothetical protein [Acidimicrobiia bacterium]MYI30434.1 hypothetical protein [Acidimicrobiia bacterium]